MWVAEIQLLGTSQLLPEGDPAPGRDVGGRHAKQSLRCWAKQSPGSQRGPTSELRLVPAVPGVRSAQKGRSTPPAPPAQLLLQVQGLVSLWGSTAKCSRAGLEGSGSTPGSRGGLTWRHLLC